MKKKLLATAVLFASTSALATAAVSENGIKETPRSGVYADTEWATAHGGPRNDDYIPSIKELPRYYGPHAEVLKGAAVLLGPTRGPNGHFYATTALDKGHSNMTAFDASGKIIWQTPPWQSADDFDAGGVIAAPIVDSSGDIYVSDANQMWAFHPDGRVKWVTELSEPVKGYSVIFDELNLPVRPNTIGNAFFTLPVKGDESTAYVGGITIYGDILIFDRQTGTIVAGPVNMPGDFEPHLHVPAPGMFAEPFVAKGFGALIETYFQGGVESANVPAVNPKDGRIFATGVSSKNPGQGAIHGFEFDPETRKINFVYEAQIGPGSGSSPAISSDYRYIYASDDTGTLFKFRTDDDSTPIWSTNVSSQPASASVGGPGDDKIYVYDDRYVYALNHRDASVAWTVDFQKIAGELLPEGPISDPTICGYSGFHNGIVVTIPGQALLTASLGYKWSPTGACAADSGSGSEAYAGGDNPLVPVGVMQGVWAVDTKTGEILRDGDRIPAQDGNEAFTVPTREGYLLMDRGVMSSGLNSFFYPYIESKFPDDFKPLLPIGGVEILAGKDDILITGLGGKVWFDEAFDDGKSSLTLSEKGRKQLQLKGEARGKGDTVYKVSLKSGRHGWGVDGHIEVKQGRKTLHKIAVTHGSFNDRSAQGTGFDKRTGRTVKWYVSDWR